LHNTSFKIYCSLTLRIIFSKENRKKTEKKRKRKLFKRLVRQSSQGFWIKNTTCIGGDFLFKTHRA